MKHARKRVLPDRWNDQGIDGREKCLGSDPAQKRYIGPTLGAGAEAAFVRIEARARDGERSGCNREFGDCVDQVLDALGGVEPAHKAEPPRTSGATRRQRW